MERNLGDPTVKISNLTVVYGYSGYGTNVRPGNRVIISFIDRSTIPVSFCRFKMFAIVPSVSTNPERLEFHTLGINTRVDDAVTDKINLDASSLCISESAMSTAEPVEE